MMKLDSASSVEQASAAYDVKSLNKLRNEAVKNDPSALQKVARQVEGLFVNMMLKSMRSALPKDGLLSSDQTRLYTSMYDQQVAQDLSAKGLGLADMMVKQLSRSVKEPVGNGVGTTPLPIDKDDFLTTSALPPALVGEFLKRTQQDGSAKALPELPPSSENFTDRLSLPSMIASLKSGIPHHLIMAQAALESGWGKREIPTSDGKPSHNLFGVKAGSNWDGKVTEIVTTEFENGRAYKVKEKFRVYDSYLDSINDYISLLTDNARYKGVVNANSAEDAAYELQRAGYATDPRYGDKLVQIIGQIKTTAEKAAKAYTHDISNLF